MAQLTEEQQAFIIRCLAEFMDYGETQAMFEERFDQEIDRVQIAYYNPESTSGGQPHQRWIDLFHKLREDAESRLKEVPIANAIYRLRRLHRISQQNEEGDPHATMRAMEMAAKEVGDLQREGLISAEFNIQMLLQQVFAGYSREELGDGELDTFLDSLPDPDAHPTAVEAASQEEEPVGSES